jgi:hypothetical protein
MKPSMCSCVVKTCGACQLYGRAHRAVVGSIAGSTGRPAFLRARAEIVDHFRANFEQQNWVLVPCVVIIIIFCIIIAIEKLLQGVREQELKAFLGSLFRQPLLVCIRAVIHSHRRLVVMVIICSLYAFTARNIATLVAKKIGTGVNSTCEVNLLACLSFIIPDL